MRIIIATPIYPPEIGGPATYTRELAERLCNEHDITIVAFADEPEHIKNTRLVVVSKKVFLPVRLLMYAYILFREAKEADIIYVQNAVASGLPAVCVGALRKKPVVLKFVGDEAWERATQAGKTRKNLDEFLAAPRGGFKISLLIAIQKYVLNRATKVVPPSEFLKNILTRHYGVGPGHVEVNYNAFKGEESENMPRTAHQILSTGRLVAWKGVDGIIRATKILRNTFTDVKLVIAGSGPEKERLQKIVEQLELKNSVDFRGSIDRSQINKLQASSAVQVLNSTYEGLPHIALESFAMHTPMVATDIPGTREAVLHEQTGLLVPPGNDIALAQAVERIFTDASLREKIVAGGARLLQEKFSWEAHIKKLLAVFASVNQNTTS